MPRTTMRVVILTMTLTVMGSLTVSPAFAHEERKVGRWHFDVGWETEPTYAGYPNAVHLGLAGADEKPVDDLGDTLKVDVVFSGQTTTLTFEPNFEVGEFGEVGNYKADLIPTRPGTYSFRINGTIKGDRIDTTFTCGEKTFDCVKDPAEQQFPAKDPNNSQLASRLTRETRRLEVQGNIAKGDAARASKVGYIGVGLGALALILTLVRRRTPRSAG